MPNDKQTIDTNHSDETEEKAAAPGETAAAANLVIEAEGEAAESAAAIEFADDHHNGAGAAAETGKPKKGRMDFRRRALLKELEDKEKEFDKLRDEYAKLVLQNAELKDRHLRLVAEMENFRKRLEREFFNRVESRLAGLLAELLPVVDDLERFFDASGDQAKDHQALAAGVRLIYQNMLKILQSHGVTAMEAVGQNFDPNRHEALMQMPVEGKAPNLVVQETTKGYLLLDKVLRPAKVIVSA
ncbi:MAG: nucleotide exchange factor GrpE [candidate division KSB1 bacterium]|nr:nucleotide exchange factor GrpE [candidate division KSB1 bacterium]MDZ7364900.1 nucleotide exchange factor GrpE [candidate division KSB1 bacterium]MDZ7403002.1 nucleotide exchange factor GrpE [candidate division KSB1 bacterium]